MTFLVIAYLGGVLTILSPCILPILPFVFSRMGQPFMKSTAPMLIGLSLTFAAVASLAAVGGSWAVHANEYGRLAALAVLTVFGLSLLSARIASFLTRPVVDLGNRLANSAGNPAAPTVAGSALLGIATGLLWAPCAGPILGLVLTGAALQGANLQTTFLLFAYAAGAATSLAIALLAGRRVFGRMKQSLHLSERLRQGLGAAVIAGVAVIAVGADTGFLARLSYASTSTFEQAVLDRFQARESSLVASNSMMMTNAAGKQPFISELGVEGSSPGLDGAVEWLNSKPLTAADLRGKVVLVDFWTYSCINCIRTVPYVRAWAEKYKDKGLVVVGVHAPEFAFEKQVENVRKAVADFGIRYPVAIDNDYRIWRAFDNSYWPAHYLIDAKGQIRYHHYGEGNYAQTEQAIQDLLREAGNKMAADATVTPNSKGAEMGPDLLNLGSGETYLGYQRASGFVSPEGILSDTSRDYSVAEPGVNEWGLTGRWTIGAEKAVLDKAGGSIAYRFSARDLHLVLGPRADGKPVRFKVTVDGKLPAENHGADIDAEGNGSVKETRLYQLVRQTTEVKAQVFEIEFLDPGAEAYVFTFG